MVVNKVELCGVNTSKLPLLREKEKEELFRRIRQGGQVGAGRIHQRKSSAGA